MKSLFKMLKLIAELEPRLWPMTVIDLMCKNISPYIDTLLGAYVLDRLIAGQGLREMLPVIIGALLLRLALKAIGEISEQIVWARSGHMHDLFMAKKSEKTLAMDYEELNSPAVNKLRDRINRDDMYGWSIDGVFETFSECLGGLISMTAAVIIVIPMLKLNAWGALYLSATAAAVAAVAVLNGKFIKKRQDIEDSYSNARSHSSYYLWGGGIDYKMGKDIRVFGAQPLIENAIAEDRAEREGRGRYVKFTRRTSAFNGLFGGLLQGSSYLYVVLSAISGALSAGDVMKFATSLYGFWGSLSSLMTQGATLIQEARRLEDTLTFLDMPDKNSGAKLPEMDGGFEIEFRNVSFTYPGSGVQALKNVSCTLKMGERVAIVGLNGSGKTTLIKLLCRLYHPSEGEILLNGVNIDEYSGDEYSRLLSVVFQDFSLFSFTLGENVAACEDWDGERVAAVLETAGFGDRLRTLEKGCETALYKNYEDDGVDISGGEAQKIALARALYKDAPFMILDEPTAALDPVAEFEIYSRFNGFTGGKCAIYISHRLSSCVFCDRIMVFEAGNLVQTGAHKELLKDEAGLYHRLWNAQAKYYE